VRNNAAGGISLKAYAYGSVHTVTDCLLMNNLLQPALFMSTAGDIHVARNSVFGNIVTTANYPASSSTPPVVMLYAEGVYKIDSNVIESNVAGVVLETFFGQA